MFIFVSEVLYETMSLNFVGYIFTSNSIIIGTAGLGL